MDDHGCRWQGGTDICRHARYALTSCIVSRHGEDLNTLAVRELHLESFCDWLNDVYSQTRVIDGRILWPQELDSDHQDPSPPAVVAEVADPAATPKAFSAAADVCEFPDFAELVSPTASSSTHAHRECSVVELTPLTPLALATELPPLDPLVPHPETPEDVVEAGDGKPHGDGKRLTCHCI